ncbi:MAG: peptidoglycan DD-metalloendopeptidase family protein [Algibacter sp.]
MTAIKFSNFLKNISTEPLRVLDASIPNSKYIALDLSKNNEALQKVDVSSSTSLFNYINAHIKKYNGLVAFGGYKEDRSIYQRSSHFNDKTVEERNIHLGVDFWSDVETLIYAPLDGVVHSFKNNTKYGDYGPTIILKHHIDGVDFYTLYGHLSLSSIKDLKVGEAFRKGECIAFLGDASVNGDYPPHLHFQIIKNIQDFKGDYPGVCSKQDLSFFTENCPDPNVLLKI